MLFTKTGGWIINHETGRYTGFCDSDRHVEPAVSVRPCSKTHESNNLLNVFPVVEDEMDDDVMDDKEEPSEESRPVKAG